MIEKIVDGFRTIASLKSFLIGLGVYLLFGAYIMPQGAKKYQEISGKKVEILDLQYSYAPEKARTIINSYGADGRAFAIKFGLLADTLYPLVYTFLFIIILALIYKSLDKYGVVSKNIHLFPILILVADYCENIGVAVLLYKYPNISDTQINVVSAFTSLKWSLVIILALIALGGLGTLLYCKLTRKPI